MSPRAILDRLAFDCAALLLRAPHKRLLTLTFHRVLPELDPLLPDEPHAAFFNQLAAFFAARFVTLPVSEALSRLASGTLPRRALCLTFDDGYANNLTVALPILKAHGLPVTIFIATAFLDGGRMFNDSVIESLRTAPQQLDLTELELGCYSLPDQQSRRCAAEEIILKLKHRDAAERARLTERLCQLAGLAARSSLMLSKAQVQELHRAGVEIGAHTETHPILAKLPAEAVNAELLNCKRQLETLIGAPVRYFAYPNGRPGTDYLPEHVELVRQAGFAASFSTVRGCADSSSDLFQLPRVSLWSASVLRCGLQMLDAGRQSSSTG